MTDTLRAKVESGKCIWQNTGDFINYFRQFEGKEIEVLASEFKNTRSARQHRYYFGCIVKAQHEEYLRRGIEKIPVLVYADGEWKTVERKTTPERIHENNKALFLPEGKESTKQLTTKEMNEYMADIRSDAYKQWGLYIEEPNENFDALCGEVEKIGGEEV